MGYQVSDGSVERRTTRRTFLRASGAAVAGAATVAGGTGVVGAQTDEFDGWFDDVSNYDGVVDRTGQDSVTVEVGVEANGGAFGFGPAAVRVSPGTTVVWEWTGEGGQHNVVAEEGAFESELVGDAGHTFEHTFEDAGTFLYACTPHRSLGMKGAVVVGEGGGSGGSGGSSGGSASGGDETATGGGNESAAGGGDGGAGAGGTTGGDTAVGELLTGLLAGAVLTVLFLLPFSELRGQRAERR